MAQTPNKPEVEEDSPTSLYETPPSSNASSNNNGEPSPSSSIQSDHCSEQIQSESQSPPPKASCSPTKGWRRLLVNDKDSWSFHFVAPDGTRFESHEQLAKHLRETTSKDVKDSDLHFLKNKEEAEAKLKVVVSVTFCNMRQNIFDIRRKRGRKRSRDVRPGIKAKRQKLQEPLHVDCSKSTSILHSILTSPLKKDKNCSISTATTTDDVSPKFDDPLRLHFEEPDDDEPLIKSHEGLLAMKRRRSSSVDLLEIPQERPPTLESAENDCEDEIASCIYDEADFEPPPLVVMGKKCSIRVTDIFRKTPLDSFICYGCSRPYDNDNDFTVDLRGQTIWIVCAHCEWWTCRKIKTHPNLEDS